MTLEKTHERITMHSRLSSGDNHYATRMVLGKPMWDHDQQIFDHLIREYGLEQRWEIRPNTQLESALKS